MREVEVTRFVAARPEEIGRILSPECVVEYEGSFSVAAVEEEADATVVTATGPGLRLPLRFEKRSDGYHYTMEGEDGPFEEMETWITVESEDEGSRVRMRSKVDLSLPLPFSDRIAAWKRRGELKRALKNLAADVE